MFNFVSTFLLIVLVATNIFSQFSSPKHELRGVWIAALGIDWPYSQGTSAAVIQNQKNQLISIFDSHRSYGLNAFFLHMRPICDALYKSNIEPWSHYITGNQGTPPSDPNYDPLTFAIEEAHKRGMELHAWLNPYRAEHKDGSPVSSNHVISKHPEWIIKCNGSEYRFLNPGLPEVRNYVVQVVMDIVNRYDVDGIHFDDYFYPYSEYGTFNDDATFALYPNGFTDKAAWRKNNVNILLKMINDSIKVVKPWIKFGISPSGNPSVNSSIYCDPEAWLKGNYTDSTGTAYSGVPYIDYIMPQLYWARYNNLLPSWTNPSFLNGRHLYVGQAAYRYEEFPSDELSWEITTNRSTPAVRGGVFFSSKSLTNNLGYCNDTLEYHYFTHPAILPKMEWIEGGSKKPNAPTNLRFEINSSSGKYEMHWDKPAPTPDGDTAFAYVVYRFENSPLNLEDSTNLFGLTGQTFLSSNDSRYSVTKGNYYAVTAIDRYSNESEISNIVTLDLPLLIPSKPVLTSPANASQDLGTSTTLVWTASQNSERYFVQVANDSTFTSSIVLLAAEYKNTQITLSNIVPGQLYYWRVKAFGQVGESEFSDKYSFQSGIPLAPILISPPHATYNVSLTPVFTWMKTNAATSYRFQLANFYSFDNNTILLDQTIPDTTFVVTTPLTPNKNHFWRVSAQNTYGTSIWSTGFGFKTTASTDIDKEEMPTEFNLKQNNPNPFNPITQIRYSLPKQTNVQLKIYDILGREVKTLINSEQAAGTYRVEWNGTDDYGVQVTSGIYIYRIITGEFVQTKKMMFLK
jgi:uncharacterized lipoprotein YddW (UPF0748 family)